VSVTTGEDSGRASAADVAIVLVAAVADNGIIGRTGGLPWRLKSDMRHFRALTVGKPVVMGRKTFLSIGQPLSGRTNIVVSRDPTLTIAGAVVTSSLDNALAIARGDALRRNAGAIMVIGGADIYAQTLPQADRLEITQVHAQPAGDAKFPPINSAAWKEIFRSDQAAGPDDDASFTILTYTRANDALYEDVRRGVR
jgi:dihydrofolate reductase